MYSNRRGTPCGEMNYPTFIENCEEDTVYEMFDHLLPNIVGPGNDGELSSSLKPFSQVLERIDSPITTLAYLINVLHILLIF